MRVVQINGVSSRGSTGRIVSQLSSMMDERGIENYVISSGYKEKKTADNVFLCSGNVGVRLHQLVGIASGQVGFCSEMATRRVISFLDKTLPDVVHLHNIYSYYLNVESLIGYLKKKDIPVVWTMHDFWPITGHCTHFEAAGCERWKTQCGNCPQRHTFPFSMFFDTSRKLYNKKKKLFSDWKKLNVVAVSEWVKENAQESILGDKSIRVISNGVDLAVFSPRNVERPEPLKGKYVILGVSMVWHAKKGYGDFLALSKMLREDEVIVLIGVTEEQIKELPSNIIGLRRTANVQQLCDYYNIADVYISASVEETMGLTVVEAMACGTPAVVYNKTALPELVPSECGVVCEEGVQNLRRAIDQIRGLGKNHFSQACIQSVWQRYEMETQYGRYCDLYEELAGMRDQDDEK